MVNLTVIRKPSPSFANNISVNEEVGDFLETPDESWSTLSPKLKQVADFVRSNDFTSKSTILGRNSNFMKPFNDVLETYQILYDSSEWAVSDPFGNLDELIQNPFQMRTNDTMDPSFAEKMNIPSSSNIIVLGDFHSGLQSFVQIVDDLVEREILSDNLELKKGYYLIMLGDIIDRGGLGLEILHLAFRLKVINFQTMVIINGNHEDVSMFSKGGFGEELQAQIEKEEDKNLIKSVLTHLPSAVFMYFNDTDEWLQLNHGGIEPSYQPLDFIESKYDFHFHGFDDDHDLKFMGLRWNDFNGNINGIAPSPRGQRVFEYGKLATEKYLKNNNLIGIVRGHQELTHFMALQRTDGSLGDLRIIPEVGMLKIPNEHWKSVKPSGWESIIFVNAFNDFSAVTTSSANRARKLGMNVYLEITNTRDDFFNSQKIIKNRFSEFELFAEEIELLEELRFILSSGFRDSKELSEEKLANWNFTIDYMKDSQKDFSYQFYHIFVLNAYGIFN